MPSFLVLPRPHRRSAPEEQVPGPRKKDTDKFGIMIFRNSWKRHWLSQQINTF